MVGETEDERDAEKKLVKDLTGLIIARAVANHWTREELAKKAQKKSAITLYGWRSGSRKSPSLLDLQAFARAVGLTVSLVPYGTPIGDGAMLNAAGGRELKPETRDVMRWMEGASDELRATIKGRVEALILERASNPLEPGEETGSPRARPKK